MGSTVSNFMVYGKSNSGMIMMLMCQDLNERTVLMGYLTMGIQWEISPTIELLRPWD